VPEQTLSKAALPRLDGVDSVRGFSILAVVLLHVWIFGHIGGLKIGRSLPEWLQFLVFHNGGNGVSVFFVVSGFLITLTSIRRFGSLERMRPAKFYRIRFARIAPLLLLLLAVLSVMHLANVPHFRIKPTVCSLPRALFAALTFHLNWLEAVRGWLPACWTVLWSLSVEEMFYVLFPLVCVGLFGRRWSKPLFFLILAALIAAGPFARTATTANEIWQGQSYLGNMDGIALGCLCALATDWFGRTRRRVGTKWLLAAQVAGAAIMLFIAVWPWPRIILGWHVKRAMGRTGTDVTVLIFGTALFLWGSVLRDRTGSRWMAPIRWFGRHSYEVYLSHEFAVIAGMLLCFKVHRGPIALWIGGVAALSALLGYGLAKWFSEPMNRRLRGAPLPTELTKETKAVFP
jgi:peptidoglycan/LPS O-acetylase OafA/YrhL